jgi:hypothetical protein
LKFHGVLGVLQIELLRLLLEKLLQKVLGRLSLAFSPLVQDWLEEALEELGHAPESCPPVEEVELLVVLFVLLTR